MLTDTIFYIGIVLLLTHELDAISSHEWRMFPFIHRLEESLGYRIFVILHIPLLLLIFWAITHSSESMRYRFQIIMDIFLILHLGIHYLFRSHPKNEFTGTFSLSLIVLTAMVGATHLILLFFG
ncbi:DUF6713 family protein [Sulfurovum sp. XGS-02]|uniref:DUF6713 family protein n=1 Tax=Sulfurovum sp. XGS-02 TaxID=2925411 RepID=UPI00353132E9